MLTVVGLCWCVERCTGNVLLVFGVERWISQAVNLRPDPYSCQFSSCC